MLLNFYNTLKKNSNKNQSDYSSPYKLKIISKQSKHLRKNRIRGCGWGVEQKPMPIHPSSFRYFSTDNWILHLHKLSQRNIINKLTI